MGEVVIEVRNLSKQYRLGSVGTGTLVHDINRWWHKIKGKDDPYLGLSETNDRTTKATSEYVWSLRDNNFTIDQGDVVGIIGRNGAGKSTLLKILSRTTSPTTGTAKIKGRVASLLEVGTGFHPELTGRENVFLNGAILGMTKKEIRRKFDEIVDFSGVERYIDTPVKRYSSGMHVRLAFAVAAYLESEILIVDEVLAVGDADFQKKCLGKMGDVSKAEGRTILFVSHNMAAINQLCSKGIVMENGFIRFQGEIYNATSFYLSQNSTAELTTSYKKKVVQNDAIELLEASVTDKFDTLKGQFSADEEIFIRLKLQKSIQVPKAQGYLVIKNQSEEVIVESDTFDFLPNVLESLDVGLHDLLLKIPARLLPNGKFIAYINFTSELLMNGFRLDSPREILSFEVHDITTVRGLNRRAKTNCIIPWQKTC